MKYIELITEAPNPDKEQAQRDLDRLNYINTYLKNNPAELGRFHKALRQKEREQKVAAGDMDADDILPKLDLKRTDPEKDHKPLVKRFIEAMVQAEGDEDDMINFVNTYGKVSYIDTEKLRTEGVRQDIKSWLGGRGEVSDQFIYSLFFSLFPKDSYGGPGETAMALLSPSITRPEGNKGDLIVDGIKVEVKGEAPQSKKGGGGGRFKDEATSIGTPNIKPIYDKVLAKQPDIKVDGFDLPTHDRISSSTRDKVFSNKFPLLNVARAIDLVDNKLADDFMKEMLTKTFVKSAENYSSLFKNWRQMNHAQLNRAATKMSYLNYKTELDAKGFEHILLINKPKEVSLYFNTNDFDTARELFKLGSVDFGDKQNMGAAQVSL